MPTGRVKWFNNRKGYGFISQDEDEKDLFVHISGISGARIKEEDPVQYEIGEGEKGPCAINVTLIEE